MNVHKMYLAQYIDSIYTYILIFTEQVGIK